MVILDAGHKATASDSGFPLPDQAGLEVLGLSAEHTRLRLHEAPGPSIGSARGRYR
jgi:hypothetical protein